MPRLYDSVLLDGNTEEQLWPEVGPMAQIILRNHLVLNLWACTVHGRTLQKETNLTYSRLGL